MPTILRYFISGSFSDLLDLRTPGSEYTLTDQQLLATGSGGVNTVWAALGVELDARNLLGGTDLVLFNYRWDQYTKDISTVSGAIVFTYTDSTSGLSEKVTVANGATTLGRDQLIFADGAVLTHHARAALQGSLGAALSSVAEQDSSLSSTAYSPPEPAGNKLRAFSSTTSATTGATFAMAEEGQSTVVTGTSRIDKVYVKAGAQVDARNLFAGEDQIYLTGNWLDYTRSLTEISGAITFTRSVNGATERVIVSNGATSFGRDRLHFADGQMSFNTLSQGNTGPNPSTTRVQIAFTPNGGEPQTEDVEVSTTQSQVLDMGVDLTRSMAPGPGGWYSGNVLVLSVSLAEAVNIDTTGGQPRLALRLGDRTVWADYSAALTGQGGQQVQEIKFSYPVQPGDAAPTGLSVQANALSLNGAQILLSATQQVADLTHSATTLASSSLGVNTDITASRMAQLSGPQLAALTRAQGQAFAAVGALQELSDAQVLALQASLIDLVPPERWAQMQALSLSGLSASQVTALSAEQAARMDSQQLLALGSKLSCLSADAIAALDLASLSQEQTHTLTGLQLQALLQQGQLQALAHPLSAQQWYAPDPLGLGLTELGNSAGTDAAERALLHDHLTQRESLQLAPINSLAQLQALASVVDRLMLTVAGAQPLVALTPDDFALLGIRGISASRWPDVLNALAEQGDAGDSVNAVAKIQALVDPLRPQITGTLALSGHAEEGGILTANTADITHPDGLPLSFSYQWQVADTANGSYTNINGATTSSYAIAPDQSEVGKFFRVVVTATNADTASSSSLTSSPSTAVADVNDAATGSAALSGSAQEGGTLTANTSGIIDPDGTALTFSYQWQMADAANGSYSDISNATGSSFSIASDQSLLGKFLRVVVTATNDGTANGTSFVSNPSAAVGDTTPPDAVDLSANPGVQSTADVAFNAPELRAGRALLPGVQAPAASDVGEVRWVLGGSWQTQAGADQLVLDSARSLNADFSAQNVSLGGVSGWAYQYTASSRTLVLSQHGGGAIPTDRLDDALAAILFKSSSASTASRNLSVAYADTAGNVGTAATVNLVTDTRPTVALRADTGRDGSDGVTKDAVLLVTGLLSGATWQYRTSSTGSWINGTGTAVSLVGASYLSGQVQVRQRDASGVFSAEALMGAFTIDTVWPTNPALRFVQDTGISSSDGYTQNGALLVNRLETDATWEYSVNGGASWQAGSGTGWTLGPGQYLAGTVQVRQTDRAGNTSTTGKNGIDWRVDEAPPQVLSFTVNGGNALLLKPGQTSTVRLVFNEPVAQLSAEDLVATGATVTGWASSDGDITWTGVLSPAAMTLASGMRLTLQGAYVDLSGRSGPTGAQSSAFDVDTLVLDANRGFAITGTRVGDYSGASLGWAGNALAADANDSKQGVLIGSPIWRSSDEAEWAEGAVHGLLGRTATSDLDLSALDPSDGRAWTWGEAEAALGWQAVGVGDVNGDGRQDLAFAAPYADAGVGADAGQVWVLLQAADGLTTLTDVAAGSGGWGVQGLAEGDALGWSVAAAGDVDGDGYDDVLMAAPYADASAEALDAGQVMLVRGRADGTAGTSTVWSSPNAGDWLGFAVAGGGDINGDGLADVLLAAPDADVTVGSDTLIDAGQVYVVYGSATGMASLADVQAGTGGRLINGFAEGQSVGHAVAVVGDVNGDGYADMVVGAPDHASARGGAWLVWGGTDDTPLDLGNPGNRAVYLFNGQDDVAQLGYAVAAAGDFNADGFADVALAAPGTDGPAGTQSGAAYVVFGKATANWGGSLDVTQLRLGDGSGLIYHGQAAGDGAAGMALAGGGDVNGDGLSDLLVGFAAAAGTRGVTQVLLGDAVYHSQAVL